MMGQNTHICFYIRYPGSPIEHICGTGSKQCLKCQWQKNKDYTDLAIVSRVALLKLVLKKIKI